MSKVTSSLTSVTLNPLVASALSDPLTTVFASKEKVPVDFI